MKKRIVRLLVIIVVISACFYGFRWYRGSVGSDESGPLKIYGTIEIRDAGLAFNEQERIVELFVEEGDRVEAGQPLALLKSDRLNASIAESTAQTASQQQVINRLKAGSRPQEIDQARAQVDAARITVGNAGKVLNRLKRTSVTGATSEQDLDDARSRLEVEKAQLQVREKALNLLIEGPRKEDIAAAEHQLEALQANLDLLAIRLGDMTLLAPTSGIIQSRILEKGEMAGPTRPVYTLAMTDPKWVRAYVPEPKLGLLKSGMKAKVISDSFPGRAFDGWVGFISPVAEFTPRTVQTEDLRTELVFETRVFVTDDSDSLRLGMPVTVMLDESGAMAAADSESSD